jgi:multicomponent Na+:H+ antiporter subunit C
MILFAALVVSVLFASGTFLLLQRDLLRVVVGIILVSNSATLFIVASGLTRGESPIYPLPEDGGVSDPLVQAMALTALVLGFGVALLLAMVYRLYASHHSVALEEIAVIEVRQAESLERADDPEGEEVPAEEQDAEPREEAGAREGSEAR